jgi:hypothetical protein
MKRTLVLVFLSAVFLSRLGPSDETCNLRGETDKFMYSIETSSSNGRAGEDRTCCSRQLATLPVAMPPGPQNDMSGWFAGAVDSALVGSCAHTKCPQVEFIDTENAKRMDDLIDKMTKVSWKQAGLPPAPADNFHTEKTLDYLFRGTLSTQQITGKTPVSDAFGYEPGTKQIGGDLIGTFTFDLKLEDPDHDTTVKEASCTWTGSILEGLGFPRSNGTQEYMIQELAKQFQPLEQLIRDYERIPEKCQIQLPDKEVEAGKTITIQLTDLLDSEGRPPQPWQRVLVKAKKGKILNGESRALSEEGYRVFKAGNGGTVDVQYQAPEKCENTEDTLTVCNTCQKGEDPGQKFAPEREIATKTFDIICNRWNVELTFTKKVAGKEQMSEGITREVGWSYSATVKAVVEFVRSSGSDRIYESKSSDLDFTDNFWQHIVVKTEDHTCEGRLSWLGTHKGTIKVPVRMKIHIRANRCSFGFGSREGEGPIIFKMGINLWGDEKCGGAKAWQGESPVKDVLFDASGVDLQNHIPKPIPFSPGQKEILGQDQWSSRLWLRFYEVKVPIDLSQFPVLSRPLLVLLTASQMMSDKIPANATLSWKATKLGQKD